MVDFSYKNFINEAGKYSINIPIDKIMRNELNNYDITNVETLRDEILSTKGLLTPLSVIGPTENDEYILISGERRLNAIKMIRENSPDIYDTLPCYVIGPADMDETEQELAIELSNIAQRNEGEAKLTGHRMNVVACLDKMREGDQEENRRLSKLVSESLELSPRYARSFSTIHKKAIDPIKELISTPVSDTDKRSTLPIMHAAKIAGMDEETQMEIAEDIKNGMKYKDAIEKHQNKEEKEPDSDFDEREDFEQETDHTVVPDKAEREENPESSTPSDDAFEAQYNSFKSDDTDDFDAKAFAEMYNQTKYKNGMYARDDYLGDDDLEDTDFSDSLPAYARQEETSVSDVTDEEVILYLNEMLESDHLKGRQEEIVELCEQIYSKFGY